MTTLEEIKQTVKNFGYPEGKLEDIFNASEFSQIPKFLFEGEQIESIVRGQLKSNPTVLGMVLGIATNKRVFFLNKKFLAGTELTEFRYKQITQINQKVAANHITIEISMLDKEDAFTTGYNEIGKKFLNTLVEHVY